MALFLLFILNILFLVALTHMSLHHNLQKLGQKKTGGILKVSTEMGFILSEYALGAILILIDLLFIVLFFNKY